MSNNAQFPLVFLIAALVVPFAFANAESASMQFQNGTPINEIQCDNPNHILVERNNGNPACVTERTAEKLGWEQIIPVESVAQNSIEYDVTLISFLEEDFVFTHKQVSTDHGISELGPGNGLYWPQYTLTFPKSAQVGVPFDVIYDYAFVIPDEETGNYVNFDEQCSEYDCGRMGLAAHVSYNVDVMTDGWESFNTTFDTKMIPMRNFTHYKYYPEFDNTQPLQETVTFVINDPGDAYRIGEINVTMSYNKDDLLYFYVDDSGNVIFDPMMTKKTFEQSVFASSDDPSMASVASAIERELDKLQERPYDQWDIEVVQAPTGLRDGPHPEVYDFFAETLLRQYPDEDNFEDLLRSWNITQSWIDDFLSVRSDLRSQIADFLTSYSLLPMAYGQEAITTVSGTLTNTDADGSLVSVHGGTVCAYDMDGSDINPIIVNNEHVCAITLQSGRFFFNVPTDDPNGSGNTDLVLRAFGKSDHFEFVKNDNLDVVINDNTRFDNISTGLQNIGSFDISERVNGEVPIEHQHFWALDRLTDIKEWYTDTVVANTEKISVVYDPTTCGSMGGANYYPHNSTMFLTHTEDEQGDDCTETLYPNIHSPLTNIPTLAHEYAHAVFYQTYDSFNSDYPEDTIVDPSGLHSPVHSNSEGSAWVEGWAFFMASVYSNTPVYQPSYMEGQWNFETRNHNEITNPNFAGKSFVDGNMGEGNVAAALWDAFDTTNEAGDDRQDLLDEIWDTMGDAVELDEDVTATDISQYKDDWDDEGNPDIENIFDHNTLVYATAPPPSGDGELIIDDFEDDLSKWTLTNGNPGLSVQWELQIPHKQISGYPATNMVAATDDDCDLSCVMTLDTSLDLSDLDSAKLLLHRWGDRSLDPDKTPMEGLLVEVSRNGGSTWSTAYEWTADEGHAVDAWFKGEDILEDDVYEIPSSHLTNGFKIRITGTSSAVAEHIYVDDVKITSPDIPFLDIMSPVITVPGPITTEATGILTSVNIGTSTATDNIDPTPIISNDAPDQFPLGTTTVTWTARDDTGNTDTATQIITIQDTTSPVFDSYQDITSDDAIVEFDLPTARDIFPVTVTCDPDSGDTFRIGTTRVTCTGTDTSGNSDTTSFNVTVRDVPQDTTPPQFTNNPENITVSTTGQGRIVQFALPPATDNSGTVNVVCSPSSGNTFQIGTTTVTCTATDPSGNSDSVSFDVIVQDTAPPQFTNTPENVTVNTSGQPRIVQFNLPPATDNSGTVNVTCTPASGSIFQIGTTIVTCTATDPTGNSIDTSFDVIVQSTDVTPPEFPDMPEDIRTVITGQVSPIDFDLPAATDDSGIVNVVCDPASGSTFQLGTTTVTCTATDPTGNFVTTSFNVTVLPPDTTPPRFPDTPENITVSTTGQLEIVQFDLPAATDDFGTVNVVCDPASGSSFPIGTTTVTCTATDPTGNSITTSFNVTVLDNTAPQFTNMPRDIGSSITNQSIRISFSLPAATDNSGTVNVVCDPAPGSTFPIGTTTVTCTATDPSNNSDSVSFNVIITAEDTTAPQFTEIPDDITVETATQSAVVQFELPHATDASGSYTLSCNPSSGSSFQIGTTTVTCTATDPSGNVGTVSFDVIVQAVEDTTPPQFTYAPEDVTLETTLLSLVVTFSLPPATDDFGSVSVVCDPASGSTFRLGTTTITCTATDPSGNFATTSYDLTLRLLDTTPPRFSDTLENITIQTVTSSAIVQFDLPVATDNLGSVSVVCDPVSGSIFPIGTTTVTCTATDDSDNSATASFDVLVEAIPDTTMPQFTDTPENVIVSTTAPSAIVQFDLPVATDDSGSVTVVCDPASGSTFQSGTTIVTCTATDDSNNTDTTSFDVIVGTPPDVTPPQFSGTPADITVHAGGQSHIVQFDLPPATDDSGSVSVVCDPESGSTFQFGTTSVTCTATDDSSNSNTVSFDVIVRAPAPILNFELNPTGTTIHVDWISSSSTGYKAIIYPTSDGLSSRIVGTTNETHFTFINLEPETEYTVEVQARMHPQTRTMLSTTTLEAPEEPELQFTPSIVSNQILVDITNNLNLVVDYKYFAEYSTNGTSFTPIIGSLSSPRHVDIVSDMIGTDVHLRIYQNIGGQKLYSDTVMLTIPDLVPPANFAISQNADMLELSWDPTLARKYIIQGDGFSEPVPYGTNSLSIPITDDMRGETVTYTIQSQFREHRSATSSASIAIP